MPEYVDDDQLDLVLEMFGTEEDLKRAKEAEKAANQTIGPFTGPVIFHTLEEARVFVLRHLDGGVQCPCCDQQAKLYKRPLNSTMVRGILWLVGETGAYRDWVAVAKDGPKWLVKAGGEFAKLAHWGLIEEMPKDPLDTTKRTSGMWRPTPKGVQFAQNNLWVPKRVHLYNNEVQGWDTEMVNVIGALGIQFNYDDLIGP